jgi:hypothetical protein
MLGKLAEVGWTTEAWAPELPAQAMQTVIFSSPGSPGLPLIVSTLKSQGWHAFLFLQNMGLLTPHIDGRLRDLILIPRGDHSIRQTPTPRKKELSAFAEAFAHDLAYYRNAVQRVRNAAEI